MPILLGRMPALHTHSWLRIPSYWIGLDQMPPGGYSKQDKGIEDKKKREKIYRNENGAKGYGQIL